jgi:PTS system fructose-specific IIC component
MADRLGLVPGIVGGLVANEIGAGFLGGLVAGLLAGSVALWLGRIRVPRPVRGVMPVVVIPLLSAFVVGFIMFVVVGQPIAAATRGMNDWLGGLSGTNAIALGALLGLMMGFDLGGPVNKVAYTFGVAALAGAAGGSSTIMAAVMAAGMAPPIALAMATVLRRTLFTEAEREAGEAAWLLGGSFITEGAIPFAAGDPVRVIPSMMIGSAVTGGLSMAFGSSSPAPHGGIWVVGLIGKPLLWVVAILIGAAVGSLCVIVAKSIGRPEPAGEATVPAGSVARASA